MPFTFSRVVAKYTAKHLLFHMLVVLAAFAVIIFIFDGLEALRRSEGKNIGLGVVVWLTALKLPSMALKTMPFAALIGGIWSYQRLSFHSELIAMRACGISVWQFALPGALAAAAVGAAVTMIFQPISAALLGKHDRLRAQYYRIDGQGTLSVASTGLWLKQSASDGGEIFVRAKKVNQADRTLSDVMFYELDSQFSFGRRIDAPVVSLENKQWNMKTASVTAGLGGVRRTTDMRLPSSVSLDDISGSFSPPESVPFWRLSEFAELLKRAGFPSTAHILHYYSLIVNPLFLGAMALFGAGFALSGRRSGEAGMQATLGLFSGFGLYFLNDVSRALGLGGKIPLEISALAAPLICFAGAVLLLLHREDG